MTTTTEKPQRVETRKGQSLVAVYIPCDVRDAWDEFVGKRPNSSLKAEIMTAMARHMANPPPLPESVPLPLPAPKRPRGRPKKILENNSRKP